MRVFLLRHGTAESFAAGGDGQRQLTAEGIAELERATAAWGRIVGSVERIYVSPLVRSRQTADVFARATGHRLPYVETGALLPDAPAARAVELLAADAAEGRAAVAMVGHETHLGRLLADLVGARTPLPLRKGMLAGVKLPAAGGPGRLALCLTVKAAGRLGAG